MFVNEKKGTVCLILNFASIFLQLRIAKVIKWAGKKAVSNYRDGLTTQRCLRPWWLPSFLNPNNKGLSVNLGSNIHNYIQPGIGRSGVPENYDSSSLCSVFV